MQAQCQGFRHTRKGVPHLKVSGKGGKNRYLPLHPGTHELGHYLLHEGEQVHLDTSPDSFTINLRNLESSKGENNDEREANLFAAELLMPAELLREELESVGDIELLGSSEFLEKLAKKYKVSVQALTFRLAYLGYIKL